MTTGFEISWEAADDITLSNLKKHHEMTKNEFKRFIDNPSESKIADLEYNMNLLRSLESLIEYYGGTV